MKLQINSKNGQRFSEWANTILGYNTNPIYTIGMYGCLITSFGNYIGKNPTQVNDILKANGGYTAGSGNFIWSKCTVLGLNQVYASPYYSDPVTSQGIAKMKSLLDEGRPLITHIDFDPKDPDDDQHWILIMGYEGDAFFAFDPWSASEINLDVYGGVARAVYEFKAYDMILPKATDDALAECLRQHTLLVDECNARTLKIAELEKKITEVVATVASQTNRIKELDESIVKSEAKVIELTPKATEWTVLSAMYPIQSATDMDEIVRTLKEELANTPTSNPLSEPLKQCKLDLTNAKKLSVKTVSKSTLLKEYISRFLPR
jgi:hypothetical protein